MNISDLKSLSELGLLELCAELMEELRNRGIIRISNNPVEDYTEKVTAKR